MFRLVFQNILRRPLRSSLTCGGIAIAVALLLLIDQVAAGYRAQLLKELKGMGVHLMLVPLGCPYDAAARVLKGSTLESSLPESALIEAKADPEVEIAAPLLVAAIPRLDQGRTDMFVGLDENGMALKIWWKVARGVDRFPTADSVILGADAGQLNCAILATRSIVRKLGERYGSREFCNEAARAMIACFLFHCERHKECSIARIA